MQTTYVSSILVVVCAYSTVYAARQYNPKFSNPFLHKRNNDLSNNASPPEQPPREEMCFTIPHLQALKEQFASYIDKNGDGRASQEEIKEYLQKYNPDATDEQVAKFITRRDTDGNGYVDFIPDYLQEISSPDYGVNTAKEWFELEDTNSDGHVSRDELVAIAVKVGMPLEEAEKTATSYYMWADANGDDKLSWDEYTHLFQA